jgi:IS30 family transposase
MNNQINDGARLRLKEQLQKYGIRRLAKQIGKSPSTVSGKLRGWVGLSRAEVYIWERAMEKK